MTTTYKEQLKKLTNEELIEVYERTKDILNMQIDLYSSPLGIRSFSERIAKVCEEMNRRKEIEKKEYIK